MGRRCHAQGKAKRARLEAHRLARRLTERGTPLWAYKCPHCHHWHLTRTPQHSNRRTPMPSQTGLQLQTQEAQTQAAERNLEQTLELIHDHQGREVRLRAPGMSCRVRYLGLEHVPGGAQPAYEFFNAASQRWERCLQGTLVAVLRRYGPYACEVADDV